METVVFNIGRSVCTVSPDRVTVIPGGACIAAGTYFVADRLSKKIKVSTQLFLLNRTINLGSREYEFDDVYRLGKVRKDTRNTQIHQLPGGDISHIEDYHKFDYTLVMYLKTGRTIKIANVSHRFRSEILPVTLAGWEAYFREKLREDRNAPVDTFAFFETVLQKMIGLPEEY